MTKFNELKKVYLDRLELYVPVVARVHGESHPEFHDIHKVYNIMTDKIEKSGTKRPDLKSDFKELRRISDNYTIPEDTCETYEAVYNMLSELDEAYFA